MTPAVPVIRNRDGNMVTVVWQKIKGINAFIILTQKHGRWHRLAVTNDHYYTILVSGDTNTHMQLGY
jgi:hypothetical protein